MRVVGGPGQVGLGHAIYFSSQVSRPAKPPACLQGLLDFMTGGPAAGSIHAAAEKRRKGGPRGSGHVRVSAGLEPKALAWKQEAEGRWTLGTDFHFISPDLCQWSPWGPWSPCQVPCSGGFRLRWRKAGGPPGGGCRGPWAQTESCNVGPCPGNPHGGIWGRGQGL